MKVKITQIILSGIILVVTAHYFAWGWTRLEEYTKTYIEQKRISLITSVAQAEGFIPAQAPDYNPELTLDDIIEQESLRAKINPALVRAMIKRESGWNPLIVSRAGAIGLMQVMPENAQFCKLEIGELYDGKKNIVCGIKLLAQALKLQQGNIINALMYYNGGNRCFNKCKETKEYPHHVLNFMATDIRG